MSTWQPIETAPKNPVGESYGPWILALHEYDGGRYQIRWECHGDKKGWFAKNEPKSFFPHHVKQWMPLP